MNVEDLVRAKTKALLQDGLKGHPNCDECQCYPECRLDCPDHIKCAERLPEYQPLFPDHFPAASRKT